jgi:hypothetical protein
MLDAVADAGAAFMAERPSPSFPEPSLALSV